MITITIDPSSVRHAVAVWEDQTLIHLGFVDNKTELIRNLVEEHKPRQAYIEGQWLGVNFASTAKLIEARSKFATILELYNIPVTVVSPRSWQSYLGLGRAKSAEIKQQTKHITNTALNRTDIDMDRADAYCIGLYALGIPHDTPTDPTNNRRGSGTVVPKSTKRRTTTPQKKASPSKKRPTKQTGTTKPKQSKTTPKPTRKKGDG